MDRIDLTGISVHGHHGLFDFERRDGQLFIADVSLGLDLGPAASTGDLSRSVDYGTLAQCIYDELSSKPVELIETLAQRVVDLCFHYEPVQWVSVTVHKPEAPIAVAFTDVAVTIERSKA
ncbi:MAG: dihydroneopterin aldolase [Propionibacteriales bacterium]|nr:dihydroneopterin aldolase [Propionibacteriales bacterium]